MAALCVLLEVAPDRNLLGLCATEDFVKCDKADCGLLRDHLMAEQNGAKSRQSDLEDIKLFTAAASLCPTLAGEHRHRVREELVRRIRGEFEEMPGLSLTSVQAIKLFGISPDVCAGILSHLIEEGVLRLKSDGRYTGRIEVA